MKKIICFAMSLLFAFCLFGCGKKENDVKIEYFAKLGQIPECDYSLGDNAGDIIKDLTKKQKENDDFYFDNIEEEDYGIIKTSDVKLTYNNKKKLSKIITFQKAYGFEIGQVSVEIKKVLEDNNIKLTERNLSEVEKGFLSCSDDATGIEIKTSNHKVIFCFEDNALFATVLI